MRKILSILLASLVTISSCKKKNIETLPQNNTPVFYLKGSFDNKDINYVAGENGMIMKNGIESRNGVDYAWGEFTDGNTSIKLGIFDGHLSNNNFLNIISVGDSLKMASKFTNILANLSKSNFSNSGKISNIDWYVNGVFRGSNNALISQPGVYDVCGNFTFSNDGTQKTICNKMYLGFEEDVTYSIKHFLSENGDVKMWVEGDVQDFNFIEWKIDNEIVGTGASYSTNIGSEELTISATVHHVNGAIREKSVVIDGTFSGHYIEDFSVCELPNFESKWDNQIGLELRLNGEIYSSMELVNNASSVVVKDVKLHDLNAKGEKIVRLNLEINTEMKSKSSGQIKPIQFNAIFAYPLQE